jgi:hypothetical protein
VWQLQRGAYEGEGYKSWVHLEGELPLTDRGDMLEDLSITRVPGKSQMVV